ncbi:MAG: hypothetical protein FWF46_02750 [Oscillospiraceae bacterium]|nr:hypothetical protein [Oscillospiraceae bacterium]
MSKRDARKKEVVNILGKIMKELKKDEYELSQEQFVYLVKKAKKAKIQMISSNQKTIENKLYLDNNEYYATCISPTNRKSHIVEEPPVFINNKICPLLPIVNLIECPDEDEFFSTVYHEFTHLLATGTWNIVETDDKYNAEVEYVNASICVDRYYYSNGNITNAKIRDFYNLVEVLNDWVASRLYETIEKRENLHNSLHRKKVFNDFLNTCIQSKLNGNYKKFIAIYFSHDSNAMEQVLLSNGKYNTLEDIDNYFNHVINENYTEFNR